jgi:protein-S-isoprenylcysteine O-methyltransferase Ste14
VIEASHARPKLANFMLAAWLIGDCVRLLQFADWSISGLTIAATVIVFVVTAALVCRRGTPMRQDLSVFSIAIVTAAIAWPLLFHELNPEAPPASNAASAVQLGALLIMLSTTIVLASNFSVIPQYRKIVVRGPYRVVRHPLYAAYLAFDAATVCDIGTLGALSLWVLEAGLLALRAEREEMLLTLCSPKYVLYLSRVRYRFMPFVY